MTEFQVNLDLHLFSLHNPIQAMFVILNRLAYNDQAYRAEILERILPEMIDITSDRLLFESMIEMIRTQGGVDIEQIRQRVLLPDFTEGYARNLELLLSYNPTPEQVRQALEILTTPPPPESPALVKWRREWEAFEAMTCPEQQAYLEQNWKDLYEIRQYSMMCFMVIKDCRQVIPYLMRHLKNDDSFLRFNALWGLSMLGCQEHRQIFIDSYLQDPDEQVRADSLVYLSYTFRGEKDLEIMQMALEAFDNPASSVAMRLAAAAAMYHQLIPAEDSPPFDWYEDDEQHLQHPVLIEAVAETRRVLAEAAKGRPDIAAGVNTES